MREKCARVLAAALMTGAIGFTLAMPALFATAHDAVRSLTAPPSSLQRSVQLVASAPSRPVRAGRVEDRRSIVRAVPAAGAPASRRGSSPAREPRPAPRPAPQPTPPPASVTETRTLASDTPAAPVAQPAPSQPPARADRGKGKTKRHDKATQTSKPVEPVMAAAPVVTTTTTTTPAEATPEPESDKGHGNDKDKEKGKDKDKGHDG